MKVQKITKEFKTFMEARKALDEIGRFPVIVIAGGWVFDEIVTINQSYNFDGIDGICLEDYSGHYEHILVGQIIEIRSTLPKDLGSVIRKVIKSSERNITILKRVQKALFYESDD